MMQNVWKLTPILRRASQATVLVALLQPAPETLDLFDDVMLLSEGEHSLASKQAHRAATADTETKSVVHVSAPVLNVGFALSLRHAGHLVYHGSTTGIMPFFNSMGFQKPERKGIAGRYLSHPCPASFIGITQCSKGHVSPTKLLLSEWGSCDPDIHNSWLLQTFCRR